jgi:phage regulator Rha-like protein
MNNVITLNHDKPVVSYGVITKFSGLTKDVVKKHIKKRIDVLIKNGLSYPFKTSEDLNYSEMVFDEKSATLLMTFLPSSSKVDVFKESLVNQFFDMRETVKLIQEKTLKEAHKKELISAVKEAKKLNSYSGMISVTKYLQEVDSSHKKDFVWDALKHMGWTYDEKKVTKYRRLTKECDELIGSTINGTGTPCFTEVALTKAINTYMFHLGSKGIAEKYN